MERGHVPGVAEHQRLHVPLALASEVASRLGRKENRQPGQISIPLPVYVRTDHVNEVAHSFQVRVRGVTDPMKSSPASGVRRMDAAQLRKLLDDVGMLLKEVDRIRLPWLARFDGKRHVIKKRRESFKILDMV